MKVIKPKLSCHKGIVLFFYFILFTNYGIAQEKEVRLAIDSYYSDNEDFTKEKKYNARNFSEVYPYDPNGFLARGIEKFEAGFYAEAKSDFSESIALAPECGVCHYFRGSNFIAMDSLIQAKIDLHKSISFDPLLIESYNELGGIYISENNLDSAKIILQNGIDYYPAFPYTYFNLGLVETLKNKPSRALKQFRKCLELEPCHLGSYSYIISILLYRRNLRKAESTLDEVLLCNPDRSEFYLWKSIVKILKTRNGDALKEITKAIAIDERYFYYFFRGTLNVKTKNYSNAISDFTTAFDLNPLDSENYQGSYSYWLIQKNYQEILTYYSAKKKDYSPLVAEKMDKGIGLLLIENYDKAIQAFNYLIKQKEEDGLIFLLLGIAKDKSWEKKEALDYYTQSIEKDNSIIQTYKQRGLLYQSKGNLKEAIRDFTKMNKLDKKSFDALGIKYFQKARKERPYDTDLMYKISENYYFLGNLNDSHSLCDSLLIINNCNTRALNLKGIIQRDSTNVEKAIDCFTKTLECSPYYIDGFINRSMMYLNKGDYSKAIYDVNKAIEQDNRNSLAYLVRAQAKYYLNDKTACSDLDKAIELGMQISDEDRKMICN